MTTTPRTAAAVAAAIAALWSTLAGALNISKLPEGSDHARAHHLATGDGVPIGIVEPPRHVDLVVDGGSVMAGPGGGWQGIRPQNNLGARLQLQLDFRDRALPITPPPAIMPDRANPRLLPRQNNKMGSTHATLVSDIAAGEDRRFTGVAPDAGVYFGGILKVNELRGGYDYLSSGHGGDNPNPAIRLFNNSFGFGNSRNGVGTAQNVRFIDWIADRRDLIVVKSSGNNGTASRTISELKFPYFSSRH